jgi:hypothetical protein
MEPEQDTREVEQPVDDEAVTERAPAAEAELKVIVQKLEVPVRPRGVLAE